ncbi:MAG: hypothetical protein LBL21_00635 [Rickettsiales bacterium]|jgi:hypothetical protein|nr:hypothetical protein [Rickettsiales bacterium]
MLINKDNAGNPENGVALFDTPAGKKKWWNIRHPDSFLFGVVPTCMFGVAFTAIMEDAVQSPPPPVKLPYTIPSSVVEIVRKIFVENPKVNVEVKICAVMLLCSVIAVAVGFAAENIAEKIDSALKNREGQKKLYSETTLKRR